MAGRLRAQGHDELEILAALLAAPERCDLPESEVRTIARSAARWPAGEPRPDRDALRSLPPIEELAKRRGWTREGLIALGAKADDAKREVHIAMRDARGNVVSWRRRKADGSPFGPGGPKALSTKGAPLGLIYNAPLPADGVLLIVEGEADAAAALSAGAAGVIATPGASPGAKVLDQLQHLAAGRECILFPDPDAAGRAWLDSVAARLLNARCRVSFIAPGEGDLDDRLRREADRGAALRAMIESAIPIEPDATAALDATTTTTTTGLVTITGAELHARELPPLRWFVGGVVPEGLTIIGGAPKSGKSFAALDLAAAVAVGGRCWDWPTESTASNALLCALEDGERRLKDRLDGLGLRLPGNVAIAFDVPPLGKGGTDAIAAWMDGDPRNRLVVIDTYGKAKGRSAKGADAYEEAVATLGPLQRVALARRGAIVCVHHTRKDSGDDTGDVFDSFLGSQGIWACCDAGIVIRRARGADSATWYRGGRDLPDDAPLAFDFRDGRWSFRGHGRAKATTPEGEVVLNVFRESGRPLHPREVTEATGLDASTVRKRIERLVESGHLLRSILGTRGPLRLAGTKERDTPRHAQVSHCHENPASPPPDWVSSKERGVSHLPLGSREEENVTPRDTPPDRLKAAPLLGQRAVCDNVTGATGGAVTSPHGRAKTKGGER